MTYRLVIALAQLNPTLGAIQANMAKARDACSKASGLISALFSELFICGYPPEDLVLRPSFVAQCKAALEELAKDTRMAPPFSWARLGLTVARCTMQWRF